MKSLLFALSVICALGLQAAKTVYVDCQMDNYDNHDGTSWEKALETIQEGVNKAVNGDTVLVAPGEYDKGEYAGVDWGVARVFIVNKGITIKSDKGKEVTHIVGRFGTGNEVGLGGDAVHGIALYTNANNNTNVVEGFTIRNCGTYRPEDRNGNKPQDPCLSGAAVHSSNKHCLVLDDCVISNCVTYKNGIVNNATLVRCRVTENRLDNGIDSNGSTHVQDVRCLHCLIDSANYFNAETRGPRTTYLGAGNYVNCTFARANASFYRVGGVHCYNTIRSCCYVNSDGGTNHRHLDDSASARYLIAPALGDYRVRAGTAAETDGDIAHIADESLVLLPPSVDRYTDLNGNTIEKTATSVMYGAIQESATPVAGCICVGSNANGTIVDHNGFPLLKDSYFHSPDPRRNFALSGVVPAGGRFWCWTFDATDYGGKGTRYPAAKHNDDGTTFVWAPSDPAKALTVSGYSTIASDRVLWAEAKDADDPEEDGSEDHPFTTLQAAVDAAPADSGQTMILAKAGHYNRGYGTREFRDCTMKARVASGSKSIRLIAVDGPERTFIEGASDPDEEKYPNGCGPDATMTIAMGGSMNVQGFTICGGRSGPGTDFWYESGRGSLYSYGVDLHVSDCIVSNNVATCYALAAGRFERCLVVDNEGGNGISYYQSIFNACVMADNRRVAAGGGLFGGGTVGMFINCSLLGTATSSAFEDDSACRFNCLVDDGGPKAFTNGTNAGCVFYGYAAYADGGSGYVVDDPLFVDKASGDLRTCTRSPAQAKSVGVLDDESSYWFFMASGDFCGDPFELDANGRPIAGAYQQTVEAAYIKAPAQGGIAIEGGKVGANVLKGDETMIVRADPEGPRPVLGLTVNGVTNAFEALDGHAYVANAAKVAAEKGLVIEPVYANEWYVDDDGSDSNSGFYPSDAKKTLQKAMEKTVAGDKVWALPGTYDEGETNQNATCIVKSRVIVPANVTLESTGGRDVTVIKGAPAKTDDGTDDPKYGMGEDGLRAVYLAGAGSKVKGFTIDDGHTKGTQNQSSPDTCGGGIFAANASAVAEDCLVTGCAAYRGAGMFGGTCIDCIFTGSHAYYGGGSTSDSRNYGCLSYGNTCTTWGVNAGFFYYSVTDHCTALDSVSQGPASAVLRNTLIVGDFYPPPTTGNVCNVVCRKNAFSGGKTADYFNDAHDCLATNAEALVLGPDYRPVIGSNVAVDRANATISERLGSTDLGGGQRVYNGAMDIGAFEADWRPVYAKDIRKSQLAVEAASPTVKDVDGIVTLNGESSLTAIWANPRQLDGKKVVQMNVTGNGTLTVKLNGETVKEVTSATADPTFTFDNALVENTLDFEYVPGEGDTGHAEILGAKSLRGLLLFVR